MNANSKPPRILVVEDEALIALHLVELLKDLGYEVVDTVHRSNQAIDAIQSGTPDLVLMDIRLDNGVDGITLAEEIYTCERTPVVFVSAYADTETLNRARLTGAFGFVTKPVQRDQLNAAIVIALEKSAEQGLPS